MKKTILMLSLAIISGNVLNAQSDKKYEKLYYKNITQEGERYSVEVDNAVSTPGETKFKLKIINKTADFLILKPEECKFTINGKDMMPKEKWLIIKPFGSDFRIINLKGPGYNAVKNYSFSTDGIYTASPNGTVVKADDFKLPPSKNDFVAGDFKCNMDKLSKETDKTEAKFKVVYGGNKIGFIDPLKSAAKMPDGNEYASKYSAGLLGGSGPIMLMKGENDSFTIKWERMEGGRKMDMQKVEMIIQWRETFTESPLVKEKATTLNFEFDQAMSDAKK